MLKIIGNEWKRHTKVNHVERTAFANPFESSKLHTTRVTQSWLRESYCCRCRAYR
jgi:hypothetical protein